MSRASTLLQEAKKKPDPKVFADKAEMFKADLRKMNKIYRDVDSEKKYKEAQKLFITFANSWEQWVYKELLNPDKIGDDGEGYYHKEVREKAWSALMDVGASNFPTEWDYKTEDHLPSVERLQKDRTTNVRRWNDSFKNAFIAIADYLSYESDKQAQDMPPIEQLSVSGVQLLIHNTPRRKEGGAEDRLKKYINKTIPNAVKLIKKYGFGNSLKDLRVYFYFDSPSGSNKAGEFDHVNKGEVSVYYPWGLDEHTLIHEIGHRFYYKELSKEIQRTWEQVITQKIIYVDDRHIEAFANKYLDDEGELKGAEKKVLAQILRSERDPENLATFAHLVHHVPRTRRVDSRETAVNHFVKFYKGKQTLPEFVTDYGATQATETFPEVFALYMVKGPRRIGTWTRAFFKTIVSTAGVKLKEMQEPENRAQTLLQLFGE